MSPWIASRSKLARTDDGCSLAPFFTHCEREFCREPIVAALLVRQSKEVPLPKMTADDPRTSATYDVLFFIAILATALALGPALAHAFELPNKIGLGRDDYFVVQRIYTGWALLGFLLLVQLLALVAVAVISRRRSDVLWFVVLAILGLIGAQTVFWIYTFPANTATQNWTQIPANWEELRRQWEYSHLAGAVFQLIAMIALIIAALRRAH
jgi:hypothetical protein